MGSKSGRLLFGRQAQPWHTAAMKTLSLIAGLGLLASVSVAEAHIRLDSPAARTTELKTGPCGAPGSVRGSNVTVLAPGATIEVGWTETINHPGHYRVSFDADGQDFTVPLSFTDVTQTMNVLVDNIADRSGQQLVYKQMVTLPNITCENCTLQVIQMMTDKPPYGDGNDIYFQCADIALRAGTPTPTVDAPTALVDAPTGADAGGMTPASGGGCATGGATGWATVMAMVGLGALGIRRRQQS
jgi:uncharacterized protein (TIGR03382 family)